MKKHDTKKDAAPIDEMASRRRGAPIGKGAAGGKSPTSPPGGSASTSGSIGGNKSPKAASPTSPKEHVSATAAAVNDSSDIELDGATDSDSEGGAFATNKALSPENKGKAAAAWGSGGGGSAGGGGGGGGGSTAESRARAQAFLSNLQAEAESDDDDDGGVMGRLKAKKEGGKPAAKPAVAVGRPKLLWDEEAPAAPAKATPAAPTARMLEEQEVALEVEDDLDALEISDEDLGDAW